MEHKVPQATNIGKKKEPTMKMVRHPDDFRSSNSIQGAQKIATLCNRRVRTHNDNISIIPVEGLCVEVKVLSEAATRARVSRRRR